MNLYELQAELGIKLVELEKAIDLGMPYTELRSIYNGIKELQYKLALASLEVKNKENSENLDIILE